MASNTTVGEPLTNIKIGFRRFIFRQLSPESLKCRSYSSLINLIEDYVSHNFIVSIVGALSSFGGPEDDIELANKFQEIALAASIENSAVIKIDKKTAFIAQLLNLSDRVTFLVCRESVASHLFHIANIEPTRFRPSTYLRLPLLSEAMMFSHLWKDGYNFNILDVREENLALFAKLVVMHEVGKAINQFHKKRIIHGDIHLGNFMVRKDFSVVCVDLGDSSFLLRDIRPEERARDIVSLLPELSPQEWGAFKAGYISESGVEGIYTIHCIEFGRRLEWLAHYRIGDRINTIKFLTESIKGYDPQESIDDIEDLYLNLGACYAELNQIPEAILSYERAEEFAASKSMNMAIVLHNLARAYMRANDYKSALSKFSKIDEIEAISSQKDLHFSYLYNKSKCFAEIGDIEMAISTNKLIYPILDVKDVELLKAANRQLTELKNNS